MKQSVFFFLIISLLSPAVSMGQNVDDVVAFANRQFELGNYSLASKEYNRAFFFGAGNKDIITLRIADCYSQLENYEQAGNFYDRAYRLSSSDSLKNEAILGKAFCLVMQDKLMLSLIELYNFEYTASKEQQSIYHFLKGLTHFGLHDDSLSYHEFVKIAELQTQQSFDIEVLDSEFEKILNYNKRYNPQRAYIMSGIIPGSGQLLTGEIKDGLNSMLLIGGLYLIALRVMHLYSFWDAAIALFPWIQRYHMGGMEHSKELAATKIDQKRYESYLNLLELTLPQRYE
ncbi:MAG: hypothetical protein PF436_08400 [Prolixibacteraceae bacterium]|jgi:tetratricopeptide (TPR) repeat protein|nr:hypothetical protein [Prolixibacteraceae bacterium]